MWPRKMAVEGKAVAEQDAVDVAGAPDMVHLLPIGEIRARDGRMFSLANPASVIAASHRSGIDLVIDYEHQSKDSSKSGAVPAAGWIKELFVRDDGVWGWVSWTEQAREHITAREYRYLSPTFLYDKGSRSITRLKSAGLVHAPAFELTALAREEEYAALARIAEALGLDDDAGEDAILAAIKEQVGTAEEQFQHTDLEVQLMRQRDEHLAVAREERVEKLGGGAVSGRAGAARSASSGARSARAGP